MQLFIFKLTTKINDSHALTKLMELQCIFCFKTMMPTKFIYEEKAIVIKRKFIFKLILNERNNH